MNASMREWERKKIKIAYFCNINLCELNVWNDLIENEYVKP